MIVCNVKMVFLTNHLSVNSKLNIMFFSILNMTLLYIYYRTLLNDFLSPPHTYTHISGHSIDLYNPTVMNVKVKLMQNVHTQEYKLHAKLKHKAKLIVSAVLIYIYIHNILLLSTPSSGGQGDTSLVMRGRDVSSQEMM